MKGGKAGDRGKEERERAHSCWRERRMKERKLIFVRASEERRYRIKEKSMAWWMQQTFILAKMSWF